MEDQKQHVIDSLKQATNILVTVRKNPSIDQLSACIALTLIVNALDKHGTAVFSGKVPTMLNFLQPDKTIERNTDSLQDFIISLDKAKADKLKYKVEDTVVKIYITPYRTSLSGKDLEFGQGDFNVDVVVALGVHSQEDVDDAITAHGRILHDATVISINTDAGANEELGSINWVGNGVSSLSEMVFDISGDLGKDNVVDNQTATALLTGIVAETERFGNSKTTPQTMEVAAKLLTDGANQELVASQLAEPAKQQQEPVKDTPTSNADVRPDSDNGRLDGRDNDSSNGSSDSGIPDMPNVAEQKDDGELDINHPYNEPVRMSEPDVLQSDILPSEMMADPLSSEESSRDVANPEDNRQPDGGQTPPVYEPERQNSPDRSTSFDQPPLESGLLDPLAQVPSQTDINQGVNEEEAALDYLKGRKVDTTANMRSRIEPLKIKPVSDKDGYLDGTPVHSADEHTKFALTPPLLGGTLTASMSAEHNTPSSDSMVNKPASEPLLQHDHPGVGPQEVDNEPSKPAASPVSQPEPLITPLIDQSSIPPAAALSSPAVSRAHQTLADLEQQLHARHTAEAEARKVPDGALDMPQPAAVPTVTLPSPLTEVLDSNSPSLKTTSPPPVPPPLPPMPA